jgi:hypothetical protein
VGELGFTYLVIVADFADWRGPYRREAVEKPTLATKTLSQHPIWQRAFHTTASQLLEYFSARPFRTSRRTPRLGDGTAWSG